MACKTQTTSYSLLSFPADERHDLSKTEYLSDPLNSSATVGIGKCVKLVLGTGVGLELCKI